MVAWATLVWLVSIVVVGLVYTLLWDLYTEFWDVAISIGGNADALGVLHAIMVWIPVAFFLSSTFWLLVQSQRREYTT